MERSSKNDGGMCSAAITVHKLTEMDVSYDVICWVLGGPSKRAKSLVERYYEWKADKGYAPKVSWRCHVFVDLEHLAVVVDRDGKRTYYKLLSYYAPFISVYTCKQGDEKGRSFRSWNEKTIKFVKHLLEQYASTYYGISDLKRALEEGRE